MNEQYIKEHYGFEDVRNVVAKLRDKDGCPWDREQTHESITGCLRDESEEVIEAIENRDYLISGGSWETCCFRCFCMQE